MIIAGYNAILPSRDLQAPTADENDQVAEDREEPKKGTQALWILLSALASLMMLAVTNEITQEVAVIPFLWVIPLAIYLVSFVLAFSSRRWYHRGIYTILFLIGTGGVLFVILNPLTNYIIQIIIYNFLLFAITMICHGELYAMRPHASHLTRFYLMVSIGGALGGVIVNLVAPYIFSGYWEFKIGLVLVGILLAILSLPRTRTRAALRYRNIVGATAVVAALSVVYLVFFSTSKDLYAHRNFYGVVNVLQREVKAISKRQISWCTAPRSMDSSILTRDLRDTPTSYFSRESGVGLAIVSNPHYGSGMRVGVLGLGVGTLAAYGQPGDYYRFYEINPVVVDLANGQGGYFSFIKDSPATIDIALGDARISLERELAEGVKNDFDILVLDTFSSDSIPAHLVTKQAFELYLQNLAPDGMIAAHISNKHLDLKPIFWQLAQFYDLDIALLNNFSGNTDPSTFPSEWVLLTRNSELLQAPAIASKADTMDGYSTDIRLWTDDYSNLFQIIK